MTCYNFKQLQDLFSSLNAVISTNESTRIIIGHVIYNPAYTYKLQLKTTHSIKRFCFSQSKLPDSFKNLSCKLGTYYIEMRLYKVICICPHCKCVRSENCLLVEETPLVRVNWLIVSAYAYTMQARMNTDAGLQYLNTTVKAVFSDFACKLIDC